MTVKELIERLSVFPKNACVNVVYEDGMGYDYIYCIGKVEGNYHSNGIDVYIRF